MVGFIVSHRHDSRHVCRPWCLQRRGRLILFYDLVISYLEQFIQTVSCRNLLHLCS